MRRCAASSYCHKEGAAARLAFECTHRKNEPRRQIRHLESTEKGAAKALHGKIAAVAVLSPPVISLLCSLSASRSACVVEAAQSDHGIRYSLGEGSEASIIDRDRVAGGRLACRA